MKKLSRDEMKNVSGGVAQDCGAKIGGTWVRIYSDGNGAATKPHAQELVSNGTASNWCCASCAWN